ncbi:MAG: S8 family peptidase [Elusimicrobia bacterium]|nr:S8 family peptidase [Elusimicrobiota bacterium]
MRSVLALAAAALLAAPASAVKIERMTRTLADGSPGQIEVVSGQALVRFAAATTSAQKAASLQAAGAVVDQELPSTGWTLVNLASGVPVATGLSSIQTVPGVLAAEPNRAYRALRLPNDPKVSQQYHLNKINAYGAWDFEVGNSSMVTIAVLDTGIDPTHGDLMGKFVAGHRFCAPGGAACVADGPTAACNHASEVAGTAAASTDNGTQVAGVSWGARLLSVRIFNTANCNPADCADAIGACVTDDAAIVRAIDYARTALAPGGYGRVVVNMSIGGAGNCAAAVQTAVTNAVAAGVVLVAAAGNDAGPVNSPGNCSGVIPVGATDASDNIASFSSRGGELSSSGLVAPGVGIVTTNLGGGTSSPDGTSFASPIVAGVAALVLSKRPTYSVADVKTVLRNSSELIGSSTLGSYRPQGNAQGAGRINAQTAAILATKGVLSLEVKDDEPTVFPNPFRPSGNKMATIVLPSSARGTFKDLKIYTIDGKLVRELKGQSWDGKNDGGNWVASGTYIVLVTTSDGAFTGKVALIR